MCKEYNQDFYKTHKKNKRRSPFAVIPYEISKLCKLRYLLISNSRISSLSDFLADLPYLEKIEAHNCNLKDIPTSVQRLIDNKKLTLISEDNESNDTISSFENGDVL